MSRRKLLKQLKQNDGFTLLEVMVAMGLGIIFFLGSLNFIQMNSAASTLNRTISSRARILAGIRSVAGMPASLRASMRAMSSKSEPVNLGLRNCVGGVNPKDCKNGHNYSLTLYLPEVILDPVTKVATSLIPITAPPARFDTFGQSCSKLSAACPLVVSTTFTPQCPPPPMASPSHANAGNLAPASVCTVAELVAVTYSVQLDKNLVAPTQPALFTFVTAVTGTVNVSVSDISGNVAF
jgi:prepilin-type N-terminal cleavage/methylation domain-containing protein